ncbi:hypothetical protein ACHAWF_008008 [Thalassiosira exigua]
MNLVQTLVVAIAATLAAVGDAFGPSPPRRPVLERRDVVSKAFASIVAASTIIPAGAATANAIQPCPPGSKNCIRQAWTPPSSTSAADAAAQLREALDVYPQEGQEGGKVDGGGYTTISDTLGSDPGAGSIAMEFRSNPKGTFAKMFNGGKPFVDDLIVEPNGSAFEFRSSSRVGDSDLGVNGKRMSYIGGLLKGKGWSGVGLPN